MKPHRPLLINSLIAFLLSISSNTTAQTEIRPYQPGITTEGITYFLPQTRLHIVVRAQRESYTPGEYAAYAQRFLDAPNVEQQPFDTWTLQSIEVTPYGVADRTQAYTIKLNHENRGLLAKGQADFNPKDGEQLKTMMAQLDQRENGLLSLFLGTKTMEEHVVTFEVTPQQAQQTLELFRFSRYLGFVDANEVAGTPIQLQVSDQLTLPEAEESPKKKKEMEDLRYRIPSNAAVRIFDNERVWFDGIIPIAQFGRIEHLGGVLFNKKFNTKVRLSPITGRVEKLDLEQLSK